MAWPLSWKTPLHIWALQCDKNGKVHAGNHSRVARCSFYGLQGAEIKFPGVDPISSLEMYRMAVQSTMLYGCATIYMSKMHL